MISNYLAHKILDHILSKTTYTAPDPVYIALFTVMPASDGSGGTEVTGGSYARIAVTNDATNWPAAALRQKKNGNDIIFVQASADWGTVVGAGIYDALSSGNLLLFGTFPIPINVLTNGIVSFSVNQFIASMA